jgi:hypothetical protein
MCTKEYPSIDRPACPYLPTEEKRYAGPVRYVFLASAMLHMVLYPEVVQMLRHILWVVTARSDTSFIMALFASPIRRSNLSITSLADRVLKISIQLHAYLDENSYAHPDFTPKSPVLPDTNEYQVLSSQLSDAALDLLRLANGPKNTFRTMTFSHTDLAAVQVALRRQFFRFIPDDNVGLSASNVAKAATMDVDRTARILKMLTTQRIFEEVDGRFRHTAASAFLKTSVFASMAEASLDDFSKATSNMDNWIEDSPYEMGPENNAFSKRFGSTFYSHLEGNSVKAKRFSEAMRSWSLGMYGYHLL